MRARSPILTAALAYARRGWAVLPLHSPTSDGCSCRRDCRSPGKHPRTKNGVHDATIDEATIRRWWSTWRNANIGIATGRGLVVLDVDPRHGGDESLRRLVKQHGPLPQTVVAVTGGGGRHFYFTSPETVRSRQLGPGLELKGEGSYVVAPPSLHVSGYRYAWALPPDAVPLAPAPEWLLNAKHAPTNGDNKNKGIPEAVEEGIPEGRRNITLTSLAGAMRRKGMDYEEILPALLAVNQRRCVPPLPETEVERIARSVSRYEPAERVGTMEKEENALPVIVVSPGEMPRVWREAEKAMLDKFPHTLFRRGTNLVRVVVTEKELQPAKGVHIPSGTAVIEDVSPHVVLDLFQRSARFVRWDARAKDYRPYDLPVRYAQQYLEAKDWKVPYLSGVLYAPCVFPDGRRLTKRGYDPATGLFLVNGDMELPERASRDDALAALRLLHKVVETFPFVTENDRAVWVAAVLTGLARPGLQEAYAFAFDAPVMRAGKTLLARSAALIVMGREPVTIQPGFDESELEKRVSAALLMGAPVILIDNVERPLRSSFLSSLLTTPEGTMVRVLGKSELRRVPSFVTIYLTGNNFTAVGDIRTRILPCRIDPQMERPEERVFLHSPIEFVLQHRDQLVRAGLTILLAFAQAGCPQLVSFSDFRDWHRFIRNALLWLDQPDPFATGGRLLEQDPEREEDAALLRALEKTFGSEPFTVNRVVEILRTTASETDELRTIRRFAETRGRVDPLRLAWAFRRLEGRHLEGLCLRRGRKSREGILWRIGKIDKDEAPSLK